MDPRENVTSAPVVRTLRIDSASETTIVPTAWLIDLVQQRDQLIAVVLRFQQEAQLARELNRVVEALERAGGDGSA
jgi:hypothetical protein